MTKEKSKTIDFIGIGAAKSGTTWIAKMLEEHPQILFASEESRKEISFFNSHSNWQGEGGYDLSTWEKGLDWYLKQFPLYEDGKVRGEFTVTYLIDELAHERIHNTFPDVKLLVILRNPVDMMYSLHNFGSASAIAEVNETFEEMIEDEKRLYLGKYHQHLKKFYDKFPSENIHVAIFEEIKENGIPEIQKIYRFLGVDDSFVPPSFNTKINEAFKPRFNFIRVIVHKALRFLHQNFRGVYFRLLDNNLLARLYSRFNKVSHKYPRMSSQVRKRLANYYHSDIEELEKLAHIDLSTWKEKDHE